MSNPSTYRLYVNGSRTEHAVKGKSPAKALVQLADLAGLTLLSQDGRYGKTADGSVSALTEPWGRAHYSDARTTRLIPTTTHRRTP